MTGALQRACHSGGWVGPPVERSETGGAVRMRALVLAGALSVVFLPACESSSGDLSGEAGGPDASIQHTSPQPDPPVVEPVLEVAVTATAVDELFPSIGQGGIAFLRPRVDTTEFGDMAQVPDCMACPFCGGCFWQIVHHDPDTGDEEVLYEDHMIESPPKVSGNNVVWVRRNSGYSVIMVHDLLTGKTTEREAPGFSWLSTTPELRGATLYWYGYLQGAGNSGLIASDVQTGQTELMFVANMWEPGFDALSGAFQHYSRTAPFAMDDTRAVWAQWHGEGVKLMTWSLSGGAPKMLARDSGWNFVHPAVSADAVAWKAYPYDEGCHNYTCDMTLRMTTGNGITEGELFSEEARPTRYARMALSASELLWLDYREGPYMVYARDLSDPSGEERRISTEDAVLSAKAPPMVYGDTMVWMDRRNDNWDIYQAPLR